jgi:hypothetical protein
MMGHTMWSAVFTIGGILLAILFSVGLAKVAVSEDEKKFCSAPTTIIYPDEKPTAAEYVCPAKEQHLHVIQEDHRRTYIRCDCN